MRSLAASIVVWSLLAPTALTQEGREVTEERLRVAYADARAAVAAELGAAFDPPLEMKLVDAVELVECIAAENLPMIRLRQPDEEKAWVEADMLASQISDIVFAKYAWSSKEFLVVRETWEAQAEMLELPALTEDATLRAVMVHELVHAIDDRQHDLGALLMRTATYDGVKAVNALIEGHAQHLARRISAARGWNDGFAAFVERRLRIELTRRQVLRAVGDELAMA